MKKRFQSRYIAQRIGLASNLNQTVLQNAHNLIMNLICILEFPDQRRFILIEGLRVGQSRWPLLCYEDVGDKKAELVT